MLKILVNCNDKLRLFHYTSYQTRRSHPLHKSFHSRPRDSLINPTHLSIHAILSFSLSFYTTQVTSARTTHVARPLARSAPRGNYIYLQIEHTRARSPRKRASRKGNFREFARLQASLDSLIFKRVREHQRGAVRHRALCESSSPTGVIHGDSFPLIICV